MCGIAGIFRPGGEVQETELRRMAAALQHRGPDANAVVSVGELGLAHTRLRIVDLSARGAQPMWSHDRRSVIVFNGEIYNHRALRRVLEARGIQFRSTSDTEVLLEAIATWGDAALGRIEGMFAFALWDVGARSLMLARDRAGEKPLYVQALPRGGVAFASEIKALSAVPSLEVRADLSKVPEYLLHGYVPAPGTFYEGVRHLLPGHVARFGEGAHEPRRYWAARFTPHDLRIPYDEAKRELRHRMRQIVRDRLQADVPVGAFLSGGLDSTAVVGVATKDLGREVHTYSIGFDDASVDESADAKVSARLLGAIHEEFIVSVDDVPPIELLVHHHDGPFADSSAIPTYLVSKLARAHVTVAVTGDGGDEVFGGYPRFVGGMLAEHVPHPIARLGRALAAGAQASGLLPTARTTASATGRALRFAQAVERPLAHRILHWNGVFSVDSVGELLRPEHRVDPATLTRPTEDVFAETEGQSPLARMLHHNFRTYLPEDLLVKVDRCSMAVSLETRSPLLDSSLIDFVGGLPDDYKVRGLTTKRLLRDTFADLYPEELLRRPKRGFGIPLATWLSTGLKPALEDALRSSTSRLHRFLDRDEIERRLFSGPLDAGRAYQAFSLWTLETWLRSLSPTP